MNKPHNLFLIGLGAIVILIFLLYKFLPTNNLLGGQSLLYLPGKSTPQLVSNNLSYTNIDILLTLATYFLIYWTTFTLIYFGVASLTTIKLEVRYVKVHFILSVVAFILVICLNRFVTMSSGYLNWGPSDIYISADNISLESMGIDEEFLLNQALTTWSSIAGFSCMIFGIMVFGINIIRGLKKI